MDGSKITKNLRDEAIRIETEMRTRLALAITTAFALVIALYWQDVVKEGVNEMLKIIGMPVVSAYVYRILAAVIVTIICVLGIWYFSKWAQKPAEQQPKDSPKHKRIKYYLHLTL